MGRQIILSENEKLNIKKMYGLINEQGEASPSNECDKLKSLMAKYLCPKCVEIENFPLPDGTYEGYQSGNFVSFEKNYKYKVLVGFGIRGQRDVSVEIKNGEPDNLEGLEGVCGYYEEKDN
jgi:hypothetical protein